MRRQPDYLPERGDLIWLSFDPQTGHEQAERRPALVLSPARYNARSGLALICPITSQIKHFSFEVLLPEGLAVGGAALADQLKSLDWKARRATFIARLPEEVTDEVLAKARTLLD